MCGRYCLTVDGSALVKLLGLEKAFSWMPRFNLAPTQMVPVVRRPPLAMAGEVKQQLDLLRWGFVPSWAKDIKVGARMINARSETVCEKPAFRSAVCQRRCLVPADGFFEWKTLAGGGKQPYCIRMRGGSLFAFAGIWEQWQGDLNQDRGLFGEDVSGGVIESFSILTTRPNRLVRSIHDRMPVILDASDFGRWLDPQVREASDVEALVAAVAQPLSDSVMEAYPVHSQMNRVAFDQPSVLEPLPNTE